MEIFPFHNLSLWLDGSHSTISSGSRFQRPPATHFNVAREEALPNLTSDPIPYLASRYARDARPAAALIRGVAMMFVMDVVMVRMLDNKQQKTISSHDRLYHVPDGPHTLPHTVDCTMHRATACCFPFESVHGRRECSVASLTISAHTHTHTRPRCD